MSRKVKSMLLVILFITSFIPVLLVFHVNAARTRSTFPTPLQYDQIEDWISVWDTLENDTGYAIHVDPFDNIYIAGSTADDTVVVKYDSSGRQQWNTTWGGHGVDTPSGILADDQGVYVVGSTSSFGAGKNDAFLLKLSSDGALDWSRYWGESDDDEGRGITQGNDDLVYICGVTENFLSSSRDMFVASFDKAGTKTWDATWGDESNEDAFDILVGGNVTIYLAGMRYEGDQAEANVVFVGLDLSGEEIFCNEWGGSGFDVGYAIDFAAGDKIALVGYSESNPFAFLEYESNGTLSQTRLHEFYDEGPKEYWAYDIVVSPYGPLYVVGMTEMGSFILSTSTYSTGYFSNLGPPAYVYRGAALDSSSDLFCVGTNRLEFSTDFIVIQAYSSPFDNVEDPPHDLEMIWQYSSDGVITPLDYGNFDGTPEKEIVCRLYTIESEWLEVIGRGGNRTWAFIPGGDATDLYGITANLDSDEQSEMLVYYSHREKSNKSIVALDSDGQSLWSWEGNMTSSRPYACDLNDDLIDEIAVGIDGGIQLWDADSAVNWIVESKHNQLVNIHSFGDYDLDDRKDLVTSFTNITSHQNISVCIVFDYDGNRLVEFPLLSMQLGHEPINEGMPIFLEIGRLSGGVGFLYGTSYNGNRTSLFLVESSGQDVLWSSPWNPATNWSWFELNKTRLADMNHDGIDEVVLTGDYIVCLMDTTGRIMWLTLTIGDFLTRPFGPLEDAYADFDRNGASELLMGWRHEVSAYDSETGHRLYQTYIDWADFVTDLDDDDEYELVGHDVYVLVVFHYGNIWQPYYPPRIDLFVVVIGLAFGSMFVAIAVWYWKSGQSAAT